MKEEMIKEIKDTFEEIEWMLNNHKAIINGKEYKCIDRGLILYIRELESENKKLKEIK